MAISWGRYSGFGAQSALGVHPHGGALTLRQSLCIAPLAAVRGQSEVHEGWRRGLFETNRGGPSSSQFLTVSAATLWAHPHHDVWEIVSIETKSLRRSAPVAPVVQRCAIHLARYGSNRLLAAVPG